MQVAEDDAKIIRVMHQRGDGSKRQFFIDKMNAQQPIKLSNLPTQTSGTIFLNNATVIQDVPDHSVQFQFRELKPEGVTKISDVMKRSSGTFTVSGAVTWSGPAHAPGDQSTKLVREGTLTDSSGSIKISVWEEHIDLIQDQKFFTITNCKLRFFYGKCLATTKATTVTSGEEQDISSIEKQQLHNTICCPEILNVSVNAYPVCNNKDCKKKIRGNPGSKIVKCLACNKSMLIKNCYLDINANFHLESDENNYSIIVFPKVLSDFLQEDVYFYKDNTDALTEKLLYMEKVDFHVSQNGKLVTKMINHCNKDLNGQ